MTYFKKPDHQYNRVIFEFTDTEMKDAGFHQTSKEPAIMEILWLLHRIAEDRTIKGDYVPPKVVAKAKREVEELQADMINSFRDEKEILDKDIHPNVASMFHNMLADEEQILQIDEKETEGA